jgi:P-type Ca2+ transporter type 2C
VSRGRWARPKEGVTKHTTASSYLPGLTTQEANKRLEQFGPNSVVPETKRTGLAALLRRVGTDPMTVLLLVAAPTYLALRDYVSAVVVLVALVPVTAVTVILEGRAERALAELNRRAALTARVWRDGQLVTLAAVGVVPGDRVELREGDVVPADGRLIDALQIAVDEAALTGEAQPVAKDPGASEVLAGTSVVSGSGTFDVTATGLRTRYGQVGELMGATRDVPTRLQRLVRRLVVYLGAAAVALSVLVAAIELARGQGWEAAIIAGVSLGIATVPEEIPLVYTLYLALGARRLARERSLVRRLSGVETLGSTTVIGADKTGTLTLGKVEVGATVTADGHRHEGGAPNAETRELLRAAVLASEPDPFDPLEQAIIHFAERNGVPARELHHGELVRDYAFDSRDRYLSHVWRHGAELQIFAKGAPEGILDRSNADPEVRARTTRANQSLADAGMRVIGVAAGPLPALGADRAADEEHLEFLGLVASRDPLRPGVAESLAECGAAGIRIVMITGDHPVTAHAVAEGLGLPHEDTRIAIGDDLDAADESEVRRLARECNIFARIRPDQKHRLVQALKADGQVVAMTGDGINDAPALREADIGVSMGQRGTEVARAAGMLVLLDDNFATIVTAVREGRRIFGNLQRAFSYLVSFHIPLVLAALVVPLTGQPLLLLPVMLILLQIVVHPTVSLVFEGDPGDPGEMRRPPRPPDAGLLSRRELALPFARGLALTAVVVGLYLARLGQGSTAAQARSLAIATLLVGQLLLVLMERAGPEPVWRVGSRGNRVLPAVVGVTLATIVAIFVVPAARDVFDLAALSPGGWVVAIGAAAFATGAWELVKLSRRK